MQEQRIEQAIVRYVGLHRVWWDKCYRRHGRAAWEQVALQLYHAMAMTSPMLRFAAQVSDTRPGMEDYSAWCREHADEEAEHEVWFAEDLATMGVDPAWVATSSPAPEVESLVGRQFPVAWRWPQAVLGYFFVAECHPADERTLERLQTEMGLSDESMRTLRFHAEEDDEHQTEIRHMMQRHLDEEAPLSAAVESARTFLSGWAALFQRLYHTEELKPLPRQVAA